MDDYWGTRKREETQHYLEIVESMRDAVLKKLERKTLMPQMNDKERKTRKGKGQAIFRAVLLNTYY
jgi:hypothetical protein